ncbi:MAG: bifunctional tetrahydrofolate synthase/dihydrofolate synthase [Povalibacter sp.]
MTRTTLSDWLSWQQSLHPSAIDLGLTRVHRTLERLGWRQPECPVITVAGTNGKGSCVAMLNSILTAAGYRVGTFTSPHLIRYNERIVVAGQEASDASLIAAFERIDRARAEDTLTFFEFNALAALLIFETAGLDAIVLEVGLGGRLDAVNAVDADVALVTSISLDHCEWLGDDVEAIGREKAGIFRSGRLAVFASADMPNSIEDQADATGAKLLRSGRDFSYTRNLEEWSLQGPKRKLSGLPNPALQGDVQFDNAAAVLTVLELLSDRLPVGSDAINAGLRRVRLAGRFQRFKRKADWILDVAHNPGAAQTLAMQLASETGRKIAVCGILADKDIDGIVGALRDTFTEWVVTGLTGERALAPQVLAERIAAQGVQVAAVASGVREACELAEEMSTQSDVIVVFGSFLTVGPALEWLTR